MATPIFCCGFECGVTGTTGQHWETPGTGITIGTSTVRAGFRALSVAVTNGNSSISSSVSFSTVSVYRFYIKFDTLPNTNCYLAWSGTGTGIDGLAFRSSDNSLYCSSSGTAFSFGLTGVAISTGIWYRIDMKLDKSATHTCNIKVDGTDLGQSGAVSAEGSGKLLLGVLSSSGSTTTTFYVDDFIASNTTGDYPIGAGYIYPYIPNADGTHNVAGANDFERSATGVDITNATTDAYTLIDDIPLKSGTPTEYINLIAPPNATDYVAVKFGLAPGLVSPGNVAPRTIEAIVAVAAQTTTANNLRISLVDNSTVDDIRNANVGSTTCIYSRKHYADPPSAATQWATGTGAGGIDSITMRCWTNDAAPDPYWASAMLEWEFSGEVPVATTSIKDMIGMGIIPFLR